MFDYFKESVEPADDTANKIAQWAREQVSERNNAERTWTVEMLDVGYEVLVIVESRRSRIPFSERLGWDHDVRLEIRTKDVVIGEKHYDNSVSGKMVRDWLMSVHTKTRTQDVEITGLDV